MKKVISFLILIAISFNVCSFASWDEYHETEENSPAYTDSGYRPVGYSGEDIVGVAQESSHSYRGQDIVAYYDKYGKRRYTTKRALDRYRSRYNMPPYLYQDLNTTWNPGYSTVGKRFYPNSNYKREVKATRKRGVLSTLLGWLL